VLSVDETEVVARATVEANRAIARLGTRCKASEFQSEKAFVEIAPGFSCNFNGTWRKRVGFYVALNDRAGAAAG
jgi:hypothetical protein